MNSYVKKKIEFLVVDTSAFINKAAIQEIGENILTVAQVIEEIKSKRQLKRLVVLPYNLSVKEAFPENIKFVSEFSKKTGDYTSLSATDINVIALTYQLEKEKNGISHLNSEPVGRPTIQSSAAIPEDLKKIAGFYVPKKESSLKAQSEKSEEASEYDSAEDEHYDSAENEDFDNSVKENDIMNDKMESRHIVRNEHCDSIENGNFDNSIKENGNVNDKTELEKIIENDNELKNMKGNYANDVTEKNNSFMKILDRDNADAEYIVEENSEECNESDDDDDDDSHWITPSNVEKAKTQIMGEINEDYQNVNVACLTTDFAMQNVLKQIGLQVISLDGKLIKQLRTFILRCYGCFKTTSNMTKVFCPNCGNKTLKKVAVSFDENGIPQLHINFRKPLTARGKKYSVPRFKGGKHSNNPVICEDQPMPQQRPSRLSRNKNDPLNDDYIAGYSPFATRDVTSKSAMLGIKPHLEMKHWMRKNPNESRRKKK